LKLKIDVPITKQPLKEEWPSFYMMGSCFAQSQAERMASLGFEVDANPFGIIYNPRSIATILERVTHNLAYSPIDFKLREKAFSWEHHGSFTYSSTEKAAEASNQILHQIKTDISKANVVVITLGTSLVYTYSGSTVANCHKIPTKEFEQKQLTFTEVKESIETITKHVSQLNKDAHILFTVSPIRHLRSGVQESSRSKATLLSALHEVIDKTKSTSYFPSYEIFIDELRDYRFAKEDMTHPTSLAQDYIWQRFCETYFSDRTIGILEEVKKYTQLTAHRPIHDPNLHQKQVTKKRITLQTNYPFLQLK
jgi:hypothetical protein|tara:strand:- start:2936 stop:3862 length:927 start_codon:yes stop_codon:yes gene_type:complete